MIDIQERKDGISFTVHVLPRSSKCSLAGIQDGAIKLKLTSPPVDGRANEECIEFLSDLLGVKKGQMDIISGQKSRNKIIRIEGITRADLEAHLFVLLQAEPSGKTLHKKDLQVTKLK